MKTSDEEFRAVLERVLGARRAVAVSELRSELTRELPDIEWTETDRVDLSNAMGGMDYESQLFAPPGHLDSVWLYAKRDWYFE